MFHEVFCRDLPDDPSAWGPLTESEPLSSSFFLARFGASIGEATIAICLVGIPIMYNGMNRIFEWTLRPKDP